MKYRNICGFLVTIMALNACGGGSTSPSEPVPSAPVLVPEPQEKTLLVESFAVDPSMQISASVTMDCNNLETDPNAAFNDVSLSVGLCYLGSKSPEDSTTSRVAGGVAVNDYNNDGRLDVYITQGRNTSGKLFSLQADGRFIDTTQQAGINTSSAGHGGAFFDINLDGQVDLLSIQEEPTVLQVFANNGDGTFTDMTESTGINLTKSTLSIAAGDHDLDGDLDLFFSHWMPFTKQNRWEFLWQNQGNATFNDVSDIVEIGTFTSAVAGSEEQLKAEYSFTPIFADINDDRFPDILLSSDYSQSQVLLNNAGTGFIDITPGAVNDNSGMGGAVADYDNDGDLDWFVSAIGEIREGLTSSPYSGSRLYQNDGIGNVTNVTNVAGVKQSYWGWGSCFADFNNDGYQDLFVVNGFDGMTEAQEVGRAYENYNHDRAVLYINDGDGTFTERGVELGITHTAMGRGLVCYDYDRDGDLDMLISNSGKAPSLLRNNNFSSGNNFLNIRLKGKSINPQAVGARIYISINGQEQMRELQLGNNYVSQNPVEAHFGLRETQIVDQVRIVWPGLEGEVSELNNVEANRFLLIHQPD
jgi:glycosyltransferase involved in cell wall biosynthesis